MRHNYDNTNMNDELKLFIYYNDKSINKIKILINRNTINKNKERYTCGKLLFNEKYGITLLSFLKCIINVCIPVVYDSISLLAF